jgi:hypothetical protein
MWKVTLVFVAMLLLCALPSCIPTVGADPLIITVARDGSNELACLEGKIACNTFEYACLVDGNGSDVTMVITYPQELLYAQETKIGLDVRNLKLIGQAENGYTFICSDIDLGLSIMSDSMGYPKQLWLENIQTLCKGALSISDIDSVSLTGFIGQGLALSYVKTVHVEDSTFIYVGDPNNYKSIIYIGSAGDLTSFTVKNSSLVHKEERGRPLLIDFWSSNGDVMILFENTNFTLTQPPPPDQPAPMRLNFLQTNSKITTLNFTISKCNFFNYNSTALEVDVQNAITVEDIYLNLLVSKFHVPLKYIMRSRVNGVVVFQGWDTRANVHTRVDGNTFIPSD